MNSAEEEKADIKKEQSGWMGRGRLEMGEDEKGGCLNAT